MCRKNKISCLLICAAFISILLSAGLIFIPAVDADQQQQQIPSKEPIIVNGDSVEYFQEQKRVVGTGNISITYKDVTLTCDTVTVYLDTREAIAEGNVKITQKSAYFTGEKINYNFDTKKGTIINGNVNARPFYGKTQKAEKAANKDIFTLQRGYITTCDFEKPHYRLQARRVEIYLNDKVIAKHILLFVGNVPVAYLPYYAQSLKDKKTHITVMPGQSKDWGYYLLTAYRYNLTDNSRGDILLDYRSKKGLAYGVNHYYDTKKVGDGAFKFYYTDENNNLAYEKTGEEKRRYRFQYRHKWDMKDQDTVATVEFNKLSDKDVIKDYFYNEYEELGAEPDNYISFVTSKEDYTTQLLLRKRFDNFYTVVERLPEYKIDIFNHKIGNTSFYYTGSASGAYLNKTFDSTTTSQGDYNSVRFDVFNQLSYNARLLKALNVTPYAGIRETYYSKNKWGDPNKIRTVFNAGADASIKFYKIYDAQTNFLGLDINKLRHIITPTASYFYVHPPTISPDNLNQFDEIDAIDKQNGVTLALENRLQTKRMYGDGMRSVDLATFIISTDYMFRLEKNSLALKTNKFESIDMKLELIPYSWAYMLADMSIDPKRYVIQSGSIDLVATGGEKWSLGISYRYEDTTGGISNLVTLDVMYKLNEKWKIRAYERFNLEKQSIEEQEYTIYRDLHCWVLELTWDIKSLSDQALWLVMRLKAFPEYPIGFKRTYSHPRFGEAGGQ